jgi:hypothetical protein
MIKTVPTPLSSYGAWRKFAQQLRRDYLLRNETKPEKIPQTALFAKYPTTDSHQTAPRLF